MDNFAFIKEHVKLKAVKRHNWGEHGRPENSAEHSWSVALLCMILYPKLNKEFPDLSLNKMLKMAIIHDLCEIYADDISAWEDYDPAVKQEKEELAVNKLFNLLERENNKEFKALWQEYEDAETDESKVVRGIDRITAAIQRLEIGESWKDIGKTELDFDNLQLPRLQCSTVLLQLHEQIKNEARKKGWFSDVKEK